MRPWTGWRGIRSLLSLPGLADTNLEEVHKVTLGRKLQPKPSSTTTTLRMVCSSPLDNNTSAGHGFHTRGLCFPVATVVEAMPGGSYDVSKGAPANTSTNASVHAFVNGQDDRRERPQLGSAVVSELIRLPSALSRSRLGSSKLQRGSATLPERPNNGSAEGPEQPKELCQGPPTSRGQHQLGSAVDSELIRLPSAFSRSRLGLNKLQQGSSTSQERPNKGSADGYPLPKPQERPHPGSAEGPKQPMLQQRPSPPREQPHQVGLAEVLPRRVRNLLGPRSLAAFTSASGGASLD